MIANRKRNWGGMAGVADDAFKNLFKEEPSKFANVMNKLGDITTAVAPSAITAISARRGAQNGAQAQNQNLPQGTTGNSLSVSSDSQKKMMIYGGLGIAAVLAIVLMSKKGKK